MEGLRGIAAVTVLIGHVQVHLANGVDVNGGPILGLLLNGLTLFFALSGFLLFRPFATGLLTGERFPEIGQFWRNRVLRIFPAYLVIFSIVSFGLGLAYVRPAGPDAGVEGTAQLVGYLTDPSIIIANLFMVQTLFPHSIKTGLGVAWSLTVELVFYLVLPLLALTAWRFLGRRVPGWVRALTPVVAVAAIGTIGKLVFAATFHPTDSAQAFYLEWGGNWYAVFARSFLVHADLFAYGMLAAVIFAMVENGTIAARHTNRVRWAAFTVGILSAASTSAFNLTTARDTAFALAFGGLILFVALPAKGDAPAVMARFLELAPIRYLGLISYSFYLWHLPVIWLLDRLGWVAPATPWGFWLNVPIVIAASAALASLTYFFVEKPPLKLKKRTDTDGSRRVKHHRARVRSAAAATE
jgi:peptidoglycan/LPS O-acetylase OafA/YrhL